MVILVLKLSHCLNNKEIIDEVGDIRGYLIASEQGLVDAAAAELQEILADIEAKIASGEYVKVDGLEEIVKINDALNEELAEKYGEEALVEITEKVDEKFAEQFDELYEKAEALAGTVAENKEALEEIKAEMEAIFAEIEKCLNGTHSFKYEVTSPAKCGVNAIERGVCSVCGETDEREAEGTALEHIFLDYVSNGDATCTADGTKTAECANGCGAMDTVADEGTKLDHADEDGDNICDTCGEQLTCEDCGRPAHDDTGIPQYICLIITFIKLIYGFPTWDMLDGVLYENIQQSIDKATDEGADIVIALGHMGILETADGWKSTDVIANTDGIDYFLDGHSHQTIEADVYQNKNNEDVILSSTGSKFNNFGVMTISGDGETSFELVNPDTVDINTMLSEGKAAYNTVKAKIDGYNSEIEYLLEEIEQQKSI